MEHTSVPMASRTRRAIRSSATRRSGALFTSWTIRRRISSIAGIPPLALHHRYKFSQRTHIDTALEMHHLAHRVPVADPAPGIELRLTTGGQVDRLLITDQSQQEPLLLLADTLSLIVLTAPQETTWQPVTEPAARAGKNFHILLVQANFLVQFTVQRLLRRFAGHQPALGKLPGIAIADAPPPEYTALRAQQDNPDIQPEALFINNPCHHLSRNCRAGGAAVRQCIFRPDWVH